jgi:GT2 family glycosyltransferase
VPRTSIVIPLFNRCDLTLACLEALVAGTDPDRYEVVLVDNASTDGSGDLLASLEGDVVVIRNDENRGFATACNQGAAAATGDLLVFLNNDTEVLPGWLEALLAAFDGDPSIGAAGARLLFPDGTIQHGGMAIVERLDVGVFEGAHRFLGQPADTPGALQPCYLQAVTGAVLGVRAHAFRGVGGFDEGYWNCFEDVDLCLQLGAAGWRVAYVPACVVVHHESQSGPERRTGIPAGAARFAERWRGRITPDAFYDGKQLRPVG